MFQAMIYFWIAIGVIVIIGSVYWWASSTRLYFYQVLAVDRGGQIVLRKPGFLSRAFSLKFLGIEKPLRTISVGIEYSIPLYEEPIFIELRGGGRVILINPKIWIEIPNEEAAKKIIRSTIDDDNLDFEKLVRKIIATTVSGYIRTLTVEEVMDVSAKEDDEDSDLWDVVRNKPFIRDLKKKGVKLHGLTYEDIEFSSEVTTLRRKEFEEALGVKIATLNAKSELQKIVGALMMLENDDDKQTFIDFKQRILTDIKDIRVDGKDGIENSLIKILETLKQ